MSALKTFVYGSFKKIFDTTFMKNRKKMVKKSVFFPFLHKNISKMVH